MSHDNARGISTDKSIWRGFWGHRRGEKKVRPGDFPPLPNFLDDVGNTGFGGRGKTGKAGNELKLRCTEIDDHGNVTTVNGEFKKSELIAKVILW